MEKFPGVVPPVITAFDSGGEIDEERNVSFIRFLIDEGVHGIFVAGSTGEYTLMSNEERRRIIDIGVKAAEGQVPLFAGTGSNSTKETISLSKHAEKAGVDGVIVSLPHYPAPDQRGIYAHYKAVAEEIDIPLFVYNWPGGMGNSISVETVARLADGGYIQGIKDSVKDIDHTSKIVLSVGEKITVWTGFASTILPALSVGADGTICTLANLVPNECVEMYNMFRGGEMEKAIKKHQKILPIIDTVTSVSDAQILKVALKMIGHDVGDAREPRSEISIDTREVLEEQLTDLGKL